MKNQTVRISIVVLVSVLTIALSASALAQSFKQIPVKGGAKMMQIASGGRSVWALATNGQPYIYQNNQFVLANTRSLSQIAVGGGNVRQADTVWALDSASHAAWLAVSARVRIAAAASTSSVELVAMDDVVRATSSPV